MRWLLVAILSRSFLAGALVQFNTATTLKPSMNHRRCFEARARSAGNPVFVRSIPLTATEKDLREAMQAFGEITSCQLVRHSDTVAEVLQPQHYGFGTVEFQHSGDAARAMAAEVLVLGHRVTVESDLTDATGREALLQQLKKCRGSKQVSAIAQSLGRPQSVREANKLVIAWGRAKDSHRAVSILETMRSDGLSPDCKTYSAAMSACEKVGKWENALELFREMQSHGIHPDAISYSAAIAACDKGHQWERALTLLDEMPSAGVEPDDITYASAICACARGGQWQKAIEMLDETRKQGLRPNLIAYTMSIDACGKAGQWERSLALLDEMRAAGSAPNAAAYSIVISACMDAGEHARATTIYRVARAEGVFELLSSDARSLKADLHGFRSDVACIAVAELLQELRHTYRPGRDLTIVTGRGKGSFKQIAVVKERVIEMLSQPPYVGLKASEPVGNPGCLIIKAAKLNAWLLTSQPRRGREGQDVN